MIRNMPDSIYLQECRLEQIIIADLITFPQYKIFQVMSQFFLSSYFCLQCYFFPFYSKLRLWKNDKFPLNPKIWHIHPSILVVFGIMQNISQIETAKNEITYEWLIYIQKLAVCENLTMKKSPICELSKKSIYKD